MESDAASVTDLFGTERITYRTPAVPAVPKVRWWSRVHSVNTARFAELPSTVLELTGITAVSVGLYQIAPPAGWIGTGLMLIVMGVASSPRTAATVANRRATPEPPKG